MPACVKKLFHAVYHTRKQKKRKDPLGKPFFLFPGFFLPANLHASPDFDFGFSKINENKPSDFSSERIKSLAITAKKNDWSSFKKLGEKRWNAS